MQTGSFILRPTADVSVEHQKSSGDYAWKLLNEEVADGDTGYIYAKTKGSTDSSRVRVTTVCQAGGTSPINYFYIRGLSIHYNAQHDGTKQSDDKQFNQGWVINRSTGKTFQQTNQHLHHNTWTDYSADITPAQVDVTDKLFSSSNIGEAFNIAIHTDGHVKAGGSLRNNKMKTTQLYLTVNYEGAPEKFDCNVIKVNSYINTASVSKTEILPGEAITLSASIATGAVFKGWYSDEACTQLVSNDLNYTIIPNASTTYYALGGPEPFTATIGNVSDFSNKATFSISPEKGEYNQEVSFSCSVTDTAYEFYGWYADSEFRNYISKEATYTTTFPTHDMIIYARIGKKRTKVTVRPTKATDPYPFRWNGSGDDLTTPRDNGPSLSLPVRYDALATNTMDATNGLLQTVPKRHDGTAFKAGLALQFAQNAYDIPENAILTNFELRIKYLTTDKSTLYEASDPTIYFGLIDYIPNEAYKDYDETPVRYYRGSAIFPATTETKIITYSEGELSLNRWTAQEIREGHFGVQIEYGNNGSNASALAIYAAELDVYYILPEETQYHIQVVNDENTRVWIDKPKNVEMVNLEGDVYVAGNTKIYIPPDGAVTNVESDEQNNEESVNMVYSGGQRYIEKSLYELFNLTNFSMDLSPMGSGDTYHKLMVPYLTEMYGFLPGKTYTVSGKYTLTAGNMKFGWTISNEGTLWQNATFSEGFAATSSLTPFTYTFTIPETATGFWAKIQIFDASENDKLYLTDFSIKGPRWSPALLSQDDQSYYMGGNDSVKIIARPKGGYRFDGWYADAGYTNLITTDQELLISSLTADKIYYAKSHYYCDVKSFTLDVPFGKGDTYFVGKVYNINTGAAPSSTVESGTSGFRTDLDLTTGIAGFIGIEVKAAVASTNGQLDLSGKINSAGMKLMFPTKKATPCGGDWYLEPGRGSATVRITKSHGAPLLPSDSIVPLVDGHPLAIFYPAIISGLGFTRKDLYQDCILNANQSSSFEYRFRIHRSSNLFAIGVNRSKFTLYFEQYQWKAKKANSSNGVINVQIAVSDTEFNSITHIEDGVIGYNNSGATWSVELHPEATWQGWYSDPGGTQLVSTDQTYHCEPNAHLTLYAKAFTKCKIAVDAEHTTYKSSHPGEIDLGTEATLTAIPEKHYYFYAWKDEDGNIVSRDPVYTLKIEKSRKLKAVSVPLNPKLYVGDKVVKYQTRRG